MDKILEQFDAIGSDWPEEQRRDMAVALAVFDANSDMSDIDPDAYAVASWLAGRVLYWLSADSNPFHPIGGLESMRSELRLDLLAACTIGRLIGY